MFQLEPDPQLKSVLKPLALDRALAKSANYGDFFQAITSENLRVVVDQGFMREMCIRDRPHED